MGRKEVRREIELSGGVADVEREARPEASAAVVGAGRRDEAAGRFPRAGGIGGVKAQIPTDVVGITDEVVRVDIREAVGSYESEGNAIAEGKAISEGEETGSSRCGRRGS